MQGWCRGLRSRPRRPGWAVVVNRVGYRMPMQAMFTVSTALLYVTAVVLVGKGVHALQEVGVVPLRPVPFPAVELLGVFPDVLSLTPQLQSSFFASGASTWASAGESKFTRKPRSA